MKTTVTKEEFEAHIKSLNAIPDGAKLNGTFIQTKYLVNDKEVARVSSDGFGTIYETVS